MFGFGKKSVTTITLLTADGVANLPQGIVVTLELLDDKLQITVKFGKNPPIFLSYAQISNIGFMTEKEIVEKSKSVLGRAAAGGLVFGGLGAVIGGMSGTGVKKEKRHHIYLVVNYVSSGSDTIKAISFEMGDLTFGLEKFTQEFKDRCGIAPASKDPVIL